MRDPFNARCSSRSHNRDAGLAVPLLRYRPAAFPGSTGRRDQRPAAMRNDGRSACAVKDRRLGGNDSRLHAASSPRNETRRGRRRARAGGRTRQPGRPCPGILRGRTRGARAEVRKERGERHEQGEHRTTQPARRGMRQSGRSGRASRHHQARAARRAARPATPAGAWPPGTFRAMRPGH